MTCRVYELETWFELKFVPFWQPNIFQGEGATTSDVIASACIDEWNGQWTESLLCVLLELVNLFVEEYAI